jgi:hypothetical protein
MSVTISSVMVQIYSSCSSPVYQKLGSGAICAPLPKNCHIAVMDSFLSPLPFHCKNDECFQKYNRDDLPQQNDLH